MSRGGTRSMPVLRTLDFPGFLPWDGLTGQAKAFYSSPTIRVGPAASQIRKRTWTKPIMFRSIESLIRLYAIAWFAAYLLLMADYWPRNRRLFYGRGEKTTAWQSAR